MGLVAAVLVRNGTLKKLSCAANILKLSKLHNLIAAMPLELILYIFLTVSLVEEVLLIVVSVVVVVTVVVEVDVVGIIVADDDDEDDDETTSSLLVFIFDELDDVMFCVI